jgi:hypothetical protein
MKADAPLFEPTTVTNNNYDVVRALPISNLTVRDYIAIQFMAARLANSGACEGEYNKTAGGFNAGTEAEYARRAYMRADALIAESDKEKSKED